MVGDKTMNMLFMPEFDPGRLQQFDGSQTVVTDRLVLFWKPPSPFGQWTSSPFEIDGTIYGCAEQYMMAAKARLFGDRAVEERIHRTMDPAEQRRLGRTVAGFDPSRWNAERFGIVLRGNLAKFGQDPELRRALLDTGTRRLVEASPQDRIWGIGLAADHPDAYDPGKWRGQNLLGTILEEVRSALVQA